jgi:predicted Zn-dependent peptidase
MTLNNSPKNSLCDIQELSRGQTFLFDPSFRGEGASVVALVKTGARNEDAHEHGISHFLEHMVFKGTRSRTAMDLTLLFGDLGAQVNAYTSDEQTVFYGTVLRENAAALHDLLLDMLMPKLDQEEFDVEKKVILEEIALYEDRPTYVLYESAIADFFQWKGVGQSVLGTTESVIDISREVMESYVRRRYTTKNVIISLSGDLSAADFAELSERRTADLPDVELAASPHSHPLLHGEEKTFSHAKNVQAHMLGLAPAPHAQDPLRYAALLTSVMIGDSQNSQLYWELVDTGLAEYASLDSEEKDGVGVWMLSMATTPERREEVRDKSLAVLRKAKESLTEEELERAKTKALSRLVMDSELPLGRAMANALSYQYRESPFVITEEMEEIRNVTLDDCRALLTEFPLDTLNLYTMLPK